MNSGHVQMSKHKQNLNEAVCKVQNVIAFNKQADGSIDKILYQIGN